MRNSTIGMVILVGLLVAACLAVGCGRIEQANDCAMNGNDCKNRTSTVDEYAEVAPTTCTVQEPSAEASPSATPTPTIIALPVTITVPAPTIEEEPNVTIIYECKKGRRHHHRHHNERD
jgi:hypothetical protein